MTTKSVKRKLTAIFSADVEGYSRLMGDDELATVETLTSYKETMRNLIVHYRGRVVDSPGDNLLAEFASVVDAVQCAVEVQQVIASKNEALAKNRRMNFRIGINLGDVIEEDACIYGDGVNIAARVESLADSGGICISGSAFEQIENKLALGYQYMGEHKVKNIAKPVRVYKVPLKPEDTVAGKAVKRSPLPLWKRKGVFAGALIVFLAIVGVGVWNFHLRTPSIEPVSQEDMDLPLPAKPSIAVLPFTNIGDPEQEYIVDGITEQIITALARNPTLFVIASNSTFTYKGRPVKVQQVSRDLGVRYVVEGSVQRADSRIRITAQLIDATKGEHMWAENFDRELKDMFALQDEIAIQILKATREKLLGFGDQACEKGTTNVEAYLKFLKAMPLNCTNEANNRLAQQILEESIALDPNFAGAYSALGISYCGQAMNGWSQSPGKDLKKAFELAQKAISLDQALHSPHVTLGWFYLLQGKHDEAIEEGKKAVALVPSSAYANFQLGAFLAFADRPEEAISVSQNALRLNPFPNDWQLWFLGNAYAIADRFEKALTYFKKAQKRNPDNIWSYSALASIYGSLGREEEAWAAAKELLRLNPKFSLKRYEKAPWYKNRDKWKSHVDGLRRAGLK